MIFSFSIRKYTLCDISASPIKDDRLDGIVRIACTVSWEELFIFQKQQIIK